MSRSHRSIDTKTNSKLNYSKAAVNPDFSQNNSVPLNQLQLLYCFTERSFADLWPRTPKSSFPQRHLETAIQWLKRCHDSSFDHGVSWGFSLKGEWRDSYRETSGYIVDTFFDLDSHFNDQDSRKRAIAISRWLTTIQEKDGSIANSRYGSEGIVFDTGQVLQGFVRAYEETQESIFLDAAIAAGHWLVTVADSSNHWSSHTHNGILHAYNARVAWKLLKLEQIYPNKRFREVALANLDFAAHQQSWGGFFHQCAFVEGEAPFTHTIAYTIRGLLEAGLLLEDQSYINSAIRGANAMKSYVHKNGFIPGQIDIYGIPVNRYSCLAGNCQMAIIWLKLFAVSGDKSFYEAARTALKYVMTCQDLQTNDLNIRGGIKGSQPIWGKYAPMSYPNWATKFFIDAMILLSNAEAIAINGQDYSQANQSKNEAVPEMAGRI